MERYGEHEERKGQKTVCENQGNSPQFLSGCDNASACICHGGRNKSKSRGLEDTPNCIGEKRVRNRDAVRDAVGNAKRNGIKNARFYQGDAGKFMVAMAEKGEKADVVFMDPPRSGSDEAFMNSVVTMQPEKIVYISCNPETQVRDLKYLTKKGYRVERICPVDMFPFTVHCECIVSMKKF